MKEIMLQLGDYQFSISTAAYQNLRRVTEYRWQGQERIHQLDALQFTGKNKDSITLDGVVFPTYKSGIGQLNDMRTLADIGEPQQLVDGLGKVHGLWVIERINEDQSVFAQAGVALRQKFTLQIRKYSDGEV